MSGPSYRCDACVRRKNRCADCRARRAEKRRELRDRKRGELICIDCAEPALDGQVRCEGHRLINNELSGAAHNAKRRKSAKRKRAA